MNSDIAQSIEANKVVFLEQNKKSDETGKFWQNKKTHKRIGNSEFLRTFLWAETRKGNMTDTRTWMKLLK